jgi:hypothetical protein
MCPSEATPIPTGGSTNAQNIEEVNKHLLSLRQVDVASLPFTPIPDGDAICSLTVIRAGALHVPSVKIVTREPGKEEVLYLPDFVFLIEKKTPNGNLLRFLFDLGLRPVRVNFGKSLESAIIVDPFKPS